MDAEMRDMERRHLSDYTNADEIIHRRARSGVCVICAKVIAEQCGCIGTYIYKDDDGRFRLRRNKRSTLPYGVVTGVSGLSRSLTILQLHPSQEAEIGFDKIIDLDVAILSGIDTTPEEKRKLGAYIDALEVSSDLFTAAD
jgi:hypothetical protein